MLQKRRHYSAVRGLRQKAERGKVSIERDAVTQLSRMVVAGSMGLAR